MEDDVLDLTVKIKKEPDYETEGMKQQMTLHKERIKQEPDDKTNIECANGCSTHIEGEEDQMSQGVLDIVKVEQTDEDEEISSPTRQYFPFHRQDYVQTHQTAEHVNKNMGHSELPHVLVQHKTKITYDKFTHRHDDNNGVSDMSQEDNTRSRMSDCQVSLQCQVKTPKSQGLCESENDYKITLQNEDSNSESEHVFSVCEENVEQCQLDTNCQWQTTAQLNNGHRIPRREKLDTSDEFAGESDEQSSLEIYKPALMKEKPYKCDLCDLGFAYVSCLIKHKMKHTVPYRCDVCDKEFVKNKAFKRHMRIHAEDKPFKCDVCNKGFTQSNTLNRHIRIHTGEKPYKCDDCGVEFREPGHLKKHKRLHSGEKPYKCDDCDLRFSNSGTLKNHKNLHSGDKPYKCDICGVAFCRNGSLKQHARKHSTEKPYKCDFCGIGFKEKGNLKSHVRVHTGEKPFICDICDAAFAGRGTLKLHRRTHTGEKPYKCDVCGVAFAGSSDLTKHKRIHTGEKPYECEICGVKFSVSGSLKKHKRIHSGETPYKCDICGVGFAGGGDLTKHERMHTGISSYRYISSEESPGTSHLIKHETINCEDSLL